MIVIPAVDLREGHCVRLREGRLDAETVFSDDPVAMAERWVAAGAERLHVVDLDGAFAGVPRQTALIAKIVEAVRPVPVQAGGGLRDLAALETVLDAGVTWTVVGTRAAVDAAFLAGERTVVELGRRARDSGAVALLYTDVSRDGTGLGPNVEATAALAMAVGLPVLASGGVGAIDHLMTLARVPGVLGTVVGRALYTGAISLADALAAVKLA